MGNRKGYLGSIMKANIIGVGSYSDVYMADLNEALCAYKQYYDPKYVKLIAQSIDRVSQFYGDERYIFPDVLIYDRVNAPYFIGYTMDLISFYDSLDKLIYLPREEKIHILKLGRDLVENFHKEYNTIHCDLTPWNFMYNKSLDKVLLGDFDTSIDLKNKTCSFSDKLYSEELLLYFKNYGVDKDADIFLYNLCCYAFLENCDYYAVIDRIRTSDFGNISGGQARRILSTYKSFESPVNKDYIIDYL